LTYPKTARRPLNRPPESFSAGLTQIAA